MDNDDALVGKLFSRRDALLLAGQAGLGFAVGGPLSQLASFSGQQTRPKLNIVASPSLEEGPFFVEQKLNRSDLTAGTTRPSVVAATPLVLEFVLLKLSGDSAKPLENAQVDLWCCDAIGVYSDVDHPMNHEKTAGQPWLRGYQLSNKDGVVKFKTIIPGWYPGRAPHIHLKVRSFSEAHKVTADFTSQIFFPEATARTAYKASAYKERGEPNTPNSRDGIFSQREPDGTRLGSLMTVDIKKALGKETYQGRVTIGLSDKNFGLQPAGRRRGRMGEVPLDWSTF